MAELTLAQRFGTSVQFNASTKTLSIDLNDLASITINNVDVGLNVSGITDANKDEYSSRILYSLLQLSQANQAENNNDETVGIYVTSQGKRSVSRNSVLQFNYQLVVNGYVNDTTATVLDPDNIGA